MKSKFQTSITLLFIFYATIIFAQPRVQYRAWNGTGYDAPANFPSNGIADDFGPRRLNDMWPGGPVGQFGSWAITGMNSFAYNGGNDDHPWDIYHFSDFKTRT